ncbi:hypothetical protein N658DRAFT_214238 [Parathielavia hyrcaniae]|uniref:Uncharacterized protein n=1 Tax=Parathielavia hyrcaniae TaxID=113614 RepID=A0AAN6PZ10_9PEZI|nr:hypothetical protein N658DRAFT_214238 [Parathielavia hyrcaniae]
MSSSGQCHRLRIRTGAAARIPLHTVRTRATIQAGMREARGTSSTPEIFTVSWSSTNFSPTTQVSSNFGSSIAQCSNRCSRIAKLPNASQTISPRHAQTAVRCSQKAAGPPLRACSR